MRRTAILSLVALVLVAGCGKQEDAKRTGEDVGKTVTNFAAGIGKGVDQALLINVALTPEMETQGLTKTNAKWSGPEGDKKVITVYLTSKTAFKGTLIAKALNKEGLEIGRTVTDVDFAADDAKNVAFKFDGATDTQLVEKYVIGIRK